MEEKLETDDIVYAIGWHMDSQRRIYDALLVVIHLLSQNREEVAKNLVGLHAEGKFMYPPPWAEVDNDDEAQ